MFTVEIKVNGALIGHIYGQNLGVELDGKTKYKYEYYEPGANKIVNGSVYCVREDGIRPLITTILNEIDNKKV